MRGNFKEDVTWGKDPESLVLPLCWVASKFKVYACAFLPALLPFTKITEYSV